MSNLVCFCDNDIAHALLTLFSFKSTFPYDEKDTFFRDIDTHTRVMESLDYKSLVQGRDNPEYRVPEYNIVNHNKVEFIKRAHAMTLGEYSHYAWIDFGFQRTRIDMNQKFDWGKLESDTIHYDVMYIPDKVEEPRAMTRQEIIRGSMFVCPASLVLWFYEAYRDMVYNFLSQGVVDDDQVIVSHVYIKNKDKFTLHVTSEWFETLKRIAM